MEAWVGWSILKYLMSGCGHMGACCLKRTDLISGCGSMETRGGWSILKYLVSGCGHMGARVGWSVLKYLVSGCGHMEARVGWSILKYLMSVCGHMGARIGWSVLKYLVSGCGHMEAHVGWSVLKYFMSGCGHMEARVGWSVLLSWDLSSRPPRGFKSRCFFKSPFLAMLAVYHNAQWFSNDIEQTRGKVVPLRKHELREPVLRIWKGGFPSLRWQTLPCYIVPPKCKINGFFNWCNRN